MAISKRANSPYWYIQFQFNGKSYIKSSKSTDKANAENMEAQWRNQLLQQQQFGTREPISIQKAFQLYATSKIELASHKALVRWCMGLINNDLIRLRILLSKETAIGTIHGISSTQRMGLLQQWLSMMMNILSKTHSHYLIVSFLNYSIPIECKEV